MTPEDRLQQLGLELPDIPEADGNYVHAVSALGTEGSSSLLFLAGKTSRVKGKLGRNLSIEEGYEGAKQAGLLQLAVLKKELGSLQRIQRIVKVLGMVNATEEFGQQPAVMNGFSDLMVDVLGPDVGRHARSAVGMASLPGGACVEVEAIVQVEKS